MAQYPLLRVRRKRTAANALGDGSAVKLADPAASITEWRLDYAGLTDAEAEALAQFFRDVGGRLETFTFLDPGANLLLWSEDLDQSAWEKSPLAVVHAEAADPFGGARAWRLANGGVMQTLNAPGWFTYCLSLYVRSEQGGSVRLARGGETAERAITARWSRVSFVSQRPDAEESVRFGVEAADGPVEIFGLQVEAQAAASGYQRTAGRGGVYPNARLAEDSFVQRTDGPGQHGCTLGIIHGERF